MRTIKFRGKSKKTGKWVYGYYVRIKATTRSLQHWVLHFIQSGYSDKYPLDKKSQICAHVSFEEVIPETIGQSTGLHDSKGNGVYEGDIIRYRTTDDRFTRNPKYANVKVRFDKERAKFTYGNYWRDLHEERIIDVLGNIHDNPELTQE